MVEEAAGDLRKRERDADIAGGCLEQDERENAPDQRGCRLGDHAQLQVKSHLRQNVERLAHQLHHGGKPCTHTAHALIPGRLLQEDSSLKDPLSLVTTYFDKSSVLMVNTVPHKGNVASASVKGLQMQSYLAT